MSLIKINNFNDEKYYISKVASMQKDCWRSNMSEAETFTHIVKYLNKKTFNEKSHPYLIKFRDIAKDIDTKDPYSSSKIDELWEEFYNYKRLMERPNLEVVK